MARSTVAVKFTGDVAHLKRSLDGVDSKLKSTGSRFASFGKTAALGLGGVAVAGVALGKTFVDAATESRKVTAQTEAVIKSMGGAAKVTARQVADLSAELSLKTGVDDELIQSGQNLLLTFKNIRNEAGKGNDIFDQATKATLDLSVAMGKDMTASATLVGKALNDPIAGLTALSRAGVQFTDQQKEQIRAMVEVGDVAGAQKIILAELAAQFGGSAEAQATAQDKLAVAWDNLKEQLGEKLLPVVERFATWLAENLPEAMAKAEAFGRRLSHWMRTHETEVRVAAYAIGTLLVGAMVAYAASAAAAAVATIAATWPILAVVAAAAALAAGLLYLRAKWDDTGSSVWKVRYALGEIGKVMAPIAAAAYMVAQGILSIARAVGNLIGRLNVLKPLLGILSRAAEMFGGGLGGKAGALIDQYAGAQSSKQAGKNASGTSNWRGGLSWVGERGPELVNLPRGSQIFSHQRSMAMAGAGGTVRQPIVLTLNGRVIAEAVAEFDTSQARNNGFT